LSMPRILFRASKDNVLPVKILSTVHPKFFTPHISIITYAFMGFLFASFGGFEQLAIISSSSMLLVYLGISLSVIKLRKTNDLNNNEFRIPGGYTVPILSILIIIWLLSNLSQNEFMGIGLFIFGLTIIYFFKKSVSRKHFK